MLIRTDTDGHVTMSLKTVLNHRKVETSCELKDDHVCLNGQRKLRKHVQGQDLEVLQKDGTTHWLALENFDKASPVEVTDHASARITDK